jgi:CheY-like chemotaxis protein
MNKTRILYVEDNDDLREMTGLLMQETRCELVLCASGEEALRAWEAEAFELVVTDISLPGMSGVDLARKLLAASPQQWIAICSGYEYGQALTDIGQNVRVLPKPFDIDDLETILQEISTASAA